RHARKSRWADGLPVARSVVMTTPDAQALHRIAEECVALVATDFERELGWELDGLLALDDVCGELVSAGPLAGERLDLWWRLVGAYAGGVLISMYAGRWIAHEQAAGAFAVDVRGTVAFPFRLAHRVLTAEPYKSLASMARALPVIAERSRQPG